MSALKSLIGAEPLDASQQLPKGVEQMPNIDELLDGAREAITEMTLVPAAAVRGGGGGGGDSEGNGGGGFGVMARPVGAYVIRDGDVHWHPAVDVNRITLGWQVVSALAVLAAWGVGRRLARR